MSYQVPRGTQDVLPQEISKWHRLEELIRQFCYVYNYEEIRTPIFEHTNVFKRGNDSSDMVNKEMYTFQLENSATSLTLRPEGTAGVVRAFVEHKLYGQPDLPLKMYYCGPQFRHERPQKGRMRIFNQFGVEEYKDKFYDSVWDTMVYKDDVYGLRITSNNLALFYNKELFEKAGLEEPKDWTWDDLREAAKKLTDPDNGIFGLDLPVYDKKGGYTWNWLPFLWQNGGELLNEDRTEAVFNSPEGVEALKFWKTMVQEDKSVPLQAAPTGVNRFTSGITAMVIDGPWNLNPFLSDPNFKDKFGVAPLPKQKTQATVVGGEGVVAFSNTKYPQEAYDYLVHLTCSDFVHTFWENWITIPPQPAEKDFYADDETYGKYLQVFSDQMEYSRTRPFTPSWPQIEDTLGIDLQGYMFNKTDDAQASLDKAVEDVNKILAEEDK